MYFSGHFICKNIVSPVIIPKLNMDCWQLLHSSGTYKRPYGFIKMACMVTLTKNAYFLVTKITFITHVNIMIKKEL
ncbi:hypothetical protein O3G_MSEX010650 [Manduca sexta]|uniref:Uncharacterized protein n=1 Tax=Manduca sexta TaxID=7130 RepID=A0A921ZJA7_MANSE|nr:hypothetical protein O3G_MSEX010650 [Manduca sexta]